jgi:GT2 family glycosyltransferase
MVTVRIFEIISDNFTVVIVFYNREAEIFHLLDQLRDQKKKKESKIVDFSGHYTRVYPKVSGLSHNEINNNNNNNNNNNHSL